MTHEYDRFETALTRALASYAERAPVDVEPSVLVADIARGASARNVTVLRRLGTRSERSRGRGPSGRQLLAAAALLLVPLLIGSGLVGSGHVTRREPAVIVAPGVSAPPAAEPSIGARNTPLDIESAATRVRLDDGRFLLLGSWDRNPQTIWDPSTGRYSEAGHLVEERGAPIAVLLENGRVLIIGGNMAQDTPTTGHATYSTAEIYDPVARTFTAAGPMVGKGWGPSAVRLKDGRVLVLDGNSVEGPDAPDTYLATAETYDPATDTFTATGPMSVGRGPAQMAVLDDGRVLVLGGRYAGTGNMETVDLFDPATDRFEPTAALPPMGEVPVAGGRWWPEEPAGAVRLLDGRVLVPGRRCLEGSTNVFEGKYPTASAIYDPSTRTFTVAKPMPHCVGTATPLSDGRIFLTAFWGTCCNLGEVFWSGVYDPATDSLTDSIVPPGGPYMTLLRLADGRVWMSAPGGGVKIFDPQQPARLRSGG
jgi:hypothetical protein